MSTQDRDTRILSAKYVISDIIPDSYSNLLFGINLEQTDYELVSSFGTQAIDQTINDIYISSQWAVGETSQIDIGARYSDQNSNIVDSFAGVFSADDSGSVFNLGYNWHQDNLKIFARADQNYRYPTVEEHTNASSVLLTQEGVSLEIGAEYQSGSDGYRATLYTINLENEIVYDSSTFLNLNLDQTQREGLILEAFNQWSKTVDTSLSLTLLDAEITDGTFEGNNLPLVPEQTVRLDTTYHYSPALLLGLEVISVGEQVFGGDFDNELSKLSSYEVVNAHLSYDFMKWVFAFRVNNLLNEEYSEAGSKFTTLEAFYPSPERNFWINAKYSFN
ncbi:MAG: TonB-dependent receptor [Gammaproteobacteria bacterium]|nr:TonB-dependent receptor [Gammaproteobacteria bacterium]